MSKRTFSLPVINLSGNDWGGEGGFVGGGSGQGGSGTNASPMSYTDWLNWDEHQDIVTDGVFNAQDYAAWWSINHWTREQWIYYNPNNDPAWEDYFD